MYMYEWIYIACSSQNLPGTSPKPSTTLQALPGTSWNYPRSLQPARNVLKPPRTSPGPPSLKHYPLVHPSPGPPKPSPEPFQKLLQLSQHSLEPPGATQEPYNSQKLPKTPQDLSWTSQLGASPAVAPLTWISGNLTRTLPEPLSPPHSVT